MNTSALVVSLLALAFTAAGLVWRALDPPPQLEIDARGIRDRRLGLGWLDWRLIDGAYRPRETDGNRLLLRVRVDDRLGRRLARRMEPRAPRPEVLELPLELAGTAYTEVEVLHEIMAHSARRAAATSELPPELGPTRLPCR